MKRRSGGRRDLRVLAASAALIALTAAVVGTVVLGTTFGQPTSVANSNDLAGPTDGSSASATPQTSDPTIPATYATTSSEPVRLVVPAMGLRTDLVRLGVDIKQSMVLPPQQRAGWYTGSVTPGEPGASVIAGFIKGRSQKPGAFADLAKLAKGDDIEVVRKDGRTVTYEVTDIATYLPKDFPADRVYERSAAPVLRLVSTGGAMEPGQVAGNVVVYADFVSIT
ncbi:sortase domain-bontaining protein [Nocardioides sp. NPDC101246]|uniref:sortase domain-containing protein n=1 Tax=Nocardioides sp. NPDC101246 TaxID=3364336 RepID=UPI0037F2D794